MTITINNKTLELVEVPEDAIDFELHEYEPYRPHITFKVGCGTESFDILRVTLPLGNYELICKASEATEEQAREIVEECWQVGYVKYPKNKKYCTGLDTATESLHSLIRSLGMDVDKTIILEKVK